MSPNLYGTLAAVGAMFALFGVLSWIAAMARNARRPHYRWAGNCIMFETGEVAPLGRCVHPDCIRRKR